MGIWGLDISLKLPTFVGSWRKPGSSRKTSTSASLTMLKPSTGWIMTNCGRFFKRWEVMTRLPDLSPEKPLCRSRSNSKNQTWKNWLVLFQVGKRVWQSCMLSPCLFNFYAEYTMWNARLMNHKLESSLPGGISTTSDMQMILLWWQKMKRSYTSWWGWKRRVKKAGLKLNIQETKIMASGPITSQHMQGEKVEAVIDFLFLGSNHCRQ